MSFDYKKYAQLLVNYSLEMKKGDKVAVRSNYIAEPLLQAISEEVHSNGGNVDFITAFKDQHELFLAHAKGAQLNHVNPLLEKVFYEYDCYLYIIAPFELKSSVEYPKENKQAYGKAASHIGKVYSERTATRALKRSLCVFPTEVAAKKAGMTLEEYQTFVFNACKLNAEDPKAEWIKVRVNQQKVVDYLNGKQKVRYVNNNGTDITFGTNGRTWINSDGRTNMPSGEVYTSPVENSVNGIVFFDTPSFYQNTIVENVRLEVKEGEVTSWDAEKGKNVLDNVMQIEGARIFGEAAIGTNYGIQQFTKNTLFDEKMGGTVHMALGQSYLQAGGKNESAVHWDLIVKMKNGGRIYADDELIYEDGKFLIN